MSIEINEDIRAIFYIAWHDSDWMGAVSDGAQGPWATYRFRYYRDAKAFDSEDVKSWYDLKPPPGATECTVDALISAFDGMIALANAQLPGGKVYRLIRGEHSLEEFADMFTQLPFVRTQVVGLSDCRETMHRRDGRVTIALLHKKTGKSASADGPENEIAQVRMKALERLVREFGGA